RASSAARAVERTRRQRRIARGRGRRADRHVAAGPGASSAAGTAIASGGCGRSTGGAAAGGAGALILTATDGEIDHVAGGQRERHDGEERALLHGVLRACCVAMRRSMAAYAVSGCSFSHCSASAAAAAPWPEAASVC